MPRILVFLLVAYSVAAPGQTPGPSVPGWGILPHDKAEATFKDPRVLAFLKNVRDGFKVSCTPPDPLSTNANVTLPKISDDAPPEVREHASTWYEVTIQCSGATTVTVDAEFTRFTGDKPLSLTLSLKQELKR
jgi:hypothetical protein